MNERPTKHDDGAVTREPAVPVELERFRGRAVLRRDAQALLTLELVPAAGEAYFVLDEDGLGALEDALRRIGRETAVGGLVVHGDARGFVAGADVALIRAVTDPDLAAGFARRGQRCFQGFADLPFPTVAAIHGPCLGGGMELALALDHRVASRDPSTKLGLPEVQLGILPGFGGTQRLPLLLGLPAALDLMLTGKTLDGERARRRGLVDACVPSSRLLERAAGLALSPPAQRRKLGLRDSILSFHRPGRALVRRKVQKQLGQGPARFFAAPRRLLEVAILGLERMPEGAYEAEALALGELAVSDECKSLVGLFFERERARKLDRELDPAGEAAPIERALVVGGGVMGAGIAALMASRGVRVRLVDVAAAPLAAAVGRLRKALDKRLRRRRIQPHEHQAALDRLEVSTLRAGHRRADLVLEAVAEDLGLKRTLFAEAAERGAADQLLATNTSSLPLAAMAEGLPHPERLIGLHFFNPPEQMPLVELIAHAQGSATHLARGAQLAAGLGKSPVLVADRPGFLVNRCLAPYLAQAVALVEEGVTAQEVDAVAEAHGMPMGPLRLLDEIGWDVAAKVCAVLGEAFPDRMQASKLFGAMVEAGLLGTKAGAGVYLHGAGKPKANPRFARLIAEQGLTRKPAHAPSRREVRERLMLPILCEALRCLEEGVVRSEAELDFAMVMGIGYPPHLGGPLRAARLEGVAEVRACLERLAPQHGPMFAAPALLADLAEAAPLRAAGGPLARLEQPDRPASAAPMSPEAAEPEPDDRPQDEVEHGTEDGEGTETSNLFEGEEQR